MAMIDHVLTVYRANLFIVKKAVEDLSDEQMVAQPKPGMNHAAWILGHLAMPRAWAADQIKPSTPLPAGWMEKFNVGTVPAAEAGKYPGKAELLKELEETHRAMEAGLKGLSEEELMAPSDERIRRMLPHVGDGLVGLMTSHESFHIGQLSAWRRAMGLKSVF